MKIILIRHGKVDMEYLRAYDSEGFDESQARYDISPLKDYTGRVGTPDGYKIYISKLQRTYDTALQVFNFNSEVKVLDLDEMIEKGEYPKSAKEKDSDPFDYNNTLLKTELLNEVPKKSFKDTTNSISMSIWTLRARMQWFFNNHRQNDIFGNLICYMNKSI